MAASWMDELNAGQRQAVTHGGGPVLVVAGAGTGKTRTLACRVAWLIDHGTAPQGILLLTFTRRAAVEMLSRARRMTGRNGSKGQVWGGTFHATANRLLRQYGRSLGLAGDFTILDQADTADLMNLIRGEQGPRKRRFPNKNTLAAIYSRMVNSRTKLGPLLEEYFPWCQNQIDGIREVFEFYTKRKREQNVLDFDDLLLYWKALCSTPDVGDVIADRFDHILVDEYQDTNAIQAEILGAMRRQNHNIMVVGDDAQAIYSFRAASIENILKFSAEFEDAGVIKLEQNYRSTGPILAASNAVMAEAKHRYTKNLFSERKSQQKPAIITCLDESEQCNEVCDRVLEKLEEGIALRKQAVLFRAGHHSDQLEVELTRRDIPFVKYGGLKFVEAAHIKDVVAMLRLMENPHDSLSWFRVLQLLDGIGPVGARKILHALNVGESQPVRSEPPAPDTLATPLHVLIHRPPPVAPAARDQFAALRCAVADCLCIGGRTCGDQLSPALQIDRLRRFYEPICHRLYDNAETRLRDLEQLEQIARGYTSRIQLISDLTLDPPTATQDWAGAPLLDEDYLVLSTIHSAKGCEWDVVHIIHAADGMIPSDLATGREQEIEEERRLLYVAMTRARDTLNLYFPLRYYWRHRPTDQHSYAQLTRFIAKSTLHLFDRVSSRSAGQPGDDETEVQTDASQLIDAMLNNLWRD